MLIPLPWARPPAVPAAAPASAVPDAELPYQVSVREYEAGWGSRLVERLGFATRAAADAFCAHYNAGNVARTAPAWYLLAEPDYRP